MNSTERGGKKGRRRLLPRPSARAAEIYRKWILLSFLLLTLAAFAVPVPPSLAASTSYATGTVNLALYDSNITEATVLSHSYGRPTFIQAANVSGIISLTGDYQYVSTVTNNVSTTVTGKGGSSSAHAGNVTVSVGVPGSSGTTVLNYSSVTSSDAPIYLSGTVTLYYQGSNGTTSATQPIAFSSGAYYVDESVEFYNIFQNVFYTNAEYAVVNVVAKSSSGAVLTEMTETIANPYAGEVHNIAFAQNIWIAAIALPAFNDTMLGAWVNGTSVLQPSLPIGGLYNIMAMIGLILLSVSIVFSFFSRKHLNQALADVAIGAAVILLFPYIYDHIAILMNYLNAYLIAYPNPYQTFLTRLWEIQTNIIAPPPTTNFMTLFTTTVFGIAYIVIWIITWIMLYLLGTVRILLLAAMLIMFPLTVALRDIKFTSKLGRMIEDTLFGIMLASILSASALATVSWLLTNWYTNTNIFFIGGFEPQWVAIAGVLVAILAPTVLAPLTSTMYEVTSQTAMAGASVGYMVASEAGGGFVAGAQAVKGAGGNIGKQFLGGVMGAGAYGGMAAGGHLFASPLMLGGSHGAVVGNMRRHAEYLVHGPGGERGSSPLLQKIGNLLGSHEENPVESRPPAGVG